MPCNVRGTAQTGFDVQYVPQQAGECTPIFHMQYVDHTNKHRRNIIRDVQIVS